MNNKDNEIIRYVSLFSGIGGHFYNVEVRTVSPITLSLVKELFDKKFFNIRIIDCIKTKIILNMEIYEENLDKI